LSNRSTHIGFGFLLSLFFISSFQFWIVSLVVLVGKLRRSLALEIDATTLRFLFILFLLLLVLLVLALFAHQIPFEVLGPFLVLSFLLPLLDLLHINDVGSAQVNLLLVLLLI
jgi:hypothetical protein